MLKTGFVSSAMCAAIAQAVNTRDFVHKVTSDLINERTLAQTSAQIEAEGCGDVDRGSMVPYRGPSSQAPYRTQNLTPGMELTGTTNLAQTLTGQAAPSPIEVGLSSHQLAQVSERNSKI